MRFEVTMSDSVSRIRLRSPERRGKLSGSPVSLLRSVSARGLLVGWFVLLGATFACPLPAAQDESKMLRDQATKFWEARVRGDWATVYGYLSEEERAGKTKDQYVEYSKEVGPWRYLHYKIGTVEASDDVGWVKVEYAAEPLRFPGLKPRRVDRWELWEKVDDRWAVVQGKRIAEFPKLPPSLRPLKEEQAVAARAEEFLKAREKGDYAAVYRLCAPNFRSQVSLEEWLAKKAQNLYVSHRILWTEVTGNEAVVRTAYEYRPNDPSVSKMDPLEDIIMYDWIKVDGQWYLNVMEQQEGSVEE